MRWSKERHVGYDNIRFTHYECETHVVTNDDVRPPLVPKADWLPWALYRKTPGRLIPLSRHATATAGMAAAKNDG